MVDMCYKVFCFSTLYDMTIWLRIHFLKRPCISLSVDRGMQGEPMNILCGNTWALFLHLFTPRLLSSPFSNTERAFVLTHSLGFLNNSVWDLAPLPDSCKWPISDTIRRRKNTDISTVKAPGSGNVYLQSCWIILLQCKKPVVPGQLFATKYGDVFRK